MDSIPVPSARAIGHFDGPPQRTPLLLVGRTREQDALREELSVAASGHGQLILVGGEAGIGKTTLARDLTRAAHELGIRILAGSCYDLTNTPPYGPWLVLFEGCRRDLDLPSLPTAFADGRLSRVSDQAALFAEVRRFFADLSAEGPGSSFLRISIGPIRPVWIFSAISVRTCGAGRCFSLRLTGSTS
jgi:hypothetical protein